MENNLTDKEIEEIEAFAKQAENELRQELGDKYDAYMAQSAERVLKNVKRIIGTQQLLADLEIEPENEDCQRCGGMGFYIPKRDFRGAMLPDWKHPKNCLRCGGSGDEPDPKHACTPQDINNGL